VSTCYSGEVAPTRGQRPEIDRALRFDTGAPWLDLLATVGSAYGPAPVERLPGLPELEKWLAHEQLTPQRPLVDADLALVKELREALRPVVLAVLAGEAVPVERLAALQTWLDRDAPLRVELRDGVPAAAAPPTIDAALARLCRQAVESLGGPERVPLGACADEACHMAFLDPGGRRRWCSAERCGVRARVRAHRARGSAGPVEG
jgi:predicted RNA-binding Zn ribbon-like protein